MGGAAVDDAHVPGVRVLTDATALSRLIAPVDRLLDRPYLRWKPATSCVAGLRLASGPAYAVAFSRSARQKLAKIVDQAPPGAVLLADIKQRIVVARPAADRDLPALRGLPVALARLLGAEPTQVRTLAYKPQRRWVGRCSTDGDGDGDYVVRVYRRQDLDRAYRSLRRARRSLGGLVPEPVDRASHLGLLVQRWSPGESLEQALLAGNADHLLASVGRRLAEVHSHRARQGHQRLPGAAPASTAALIAALDADLGRWAAALARRLVRHNSEAGADVLVHGDFSADQIVVGREGGLTFLDWDRAGTGPAAVDLAGIRAAGLGRDAWARILDGYAALRPLPIDLDQHVAVALFERAPEPFRRGRGDWRTGIARRLADVEDLLR